MCNLKAQKHTPDNNKNKHQHAVYHHGKVFQNDLLYAAGVSSYNKQNTNEQSKSERHKSLIPVNSWQSEDSICFYKW